MAAVIPGYHGNLLEVDLSTGEIYTRELDSETLQSTVGGTGLGTRILGDELAPGTDPLSENALLLLLAGPLAATRLCPAPTAPALFVNPPRDRNLGRSGRGREVRRKEDTLPRWLSRREIGDQLPRMLKEYYRIRNLGEVLSGDYFYGTNKA